MNTEPSLSNQRLLNLILILLTAPVIYNLWDIFVVEGTLSVAKIDSGKIWWFLELALSITVIILLVFRKFGILLFAIAAAIIKATNLLFIFDRTDNLSAAFWIFQSINLAALVSMIILLKKENNRFFNLELRSKPTGFEKTFRLMIVFNSIFLITRVTEISIAVYLYSIQPHILLNVFTITLLAMLILTVVGIGTRTKLINLAFALIAFSLFQTFIYNGYFLFAPFTENWSDASASIYLNYAIVLDFLFLIFGFLMFFIIKTYFKEKAELKIQSGPDISL